MPAATNTKMSQDSIGQETFDPKCLLRVKAAGAMRGEKLYRPLGRNGEMVSAMGLGGSHIGKAPVDEPLSKKLI